MIHAVTRANRHLYRRQLWEMFTGRRDAFYDRCGWKDLLVYDGAEADDFDDEKTVYLLALDDHEDLEAAVRIRPTTDKCILVDKYPEMIGPDAPCLKGPEAWESSRIFTTERHRESADKGRRRTREVGIASLEYILAAGGKRSVGMIDLHLFPWVADATAGRIRMAGPPKEYAYGVMVGTWLEISEEELEQNRDAIGQPPELRLVYEVDDDDIAAWGSLCAIQREVDRARAFTAAAADEQAQLPDREAVVRATVLFAKHDALAAASADALDRGWDAEGRARRQA